MGLNPGTRIGAYEVTSLLGKGGMGEVYRAHDDRLGRDVALKVLPEVFASDPDRLTRFEREARVLASLTHANIGAIYGLEEGTADGRPIRALVLELVEGDTLADRIAQGPLGLDDLLPIARQIAEALEAAHEQGIIHRDLKPANIKLTPNGVVKVLDFGLARLAGGAAQTTGSGGASTDPLAALSMSPTIAMPGGTVVGLVLGTAAYMSPEQAKGRTADKRSDMWAFGCVLYEMLTGRPIFKGDDVSETLAEVIKSNVSWEALPANTPAALRRLLRRCLVKDPKGRIADAGVARLEIDEALTQQDVPVVSPPRSSRPTWQRTAPVAAALLVGVVLGGAVATGFIRTGTRSLSVTTRFPVAFPAGVRLTGNASQRLAVSRDGRRIYYNGSGAGIERLYVHPLDRLDATAVPGIEGDLGSIFLSPDGEWIGYNDARAGQFKKVRSSGGPPATICSVPAAAGGFQGATWGSSGLIVFATGNNRGLMQVPDGGGSPTPLTSPMDEQHRQPVFLPEGRAVLFTIVRPNQPSQIAALDIDTGESKNLVQGSSARYSETGHLIFLRENALWAVAFDPSRLEISGDPVPVLEGVGRQFNTALFDIAANGTLVYTPASGESSRRTLAWVDRNGREEAIPAPPRAYDSVRVSPDGATLALEARDEENDIWIWHLVRRTLTRLTFDRAVDGAPEWTPDGRRIVFGSDREGDVVNLYWQPADGTGSPERLADGPGTQFPTQVSPDGMVALFVDQRDGPADLLAVSLTRPEGASGPREITTLLKTAFIERTGVISPDGRWLAYESNASGQLEIYVRPYPDVSGGQWQVSTTGGEKPRWARDSRELFFVNEGTVMAVGVEPGPGWTAGVPQAVVKGPYAFDRNRPYDVSLDGKRFVLIKEESNASEPSGPAIVVVENWTEELKKLVK